MENQLLDYIYRLDYKIKKEASDNKGREQGIFIWFSYFIIFIGFSYFMIFLVFHI